MIITVTDDENGFGGRGCLGETNGSPFGRGGAVEGRGNEKEGSGCEKGCKRWCWERPGETAELVVGGGAFSYDTGGKEWSVENVRT